MNHPDPALLRVVRLDTAAQGLPEHIEDPATVAQVVALLKPPPATAAPRPHTRHEEGGTAA